MFESIDLDFELIIFLFELLDTTISTSDDQPCYQYDEDGDEDDSPVEDFIDEVILDTDISLEFHRNGLSILTGVFEGDFRLDMLGCYTDLEFLPWVERRRILG